MFHEKWKITPSQTYSSIFKNRETDYLLDQKSQNLHKFSKRDTIKMGSTSSETEAKKQQQKRHLENSQIFHC